MEALDSRPFLLRRVIVDMLPYEIPDVDLLNLQERMGLVPSSPDVLEMDRKESAARIQGLKPISEALTAMSSLSAEAIAEYFLMQVHFDEDDEENVPVDYLRSVLIRQNMNVIVTSVHAIVSHLVASGVLVFNKDHQ